MLIAMAQITRDVIYSRSSLDRPPGTDTRWDWVKTRFKFSHTIMPMPGEQYVECGPRLCDLQSHLLLIVVSIADACQDIDDESSWDTESGEWRGCIS